MTRDEAWSVVCEFVKSDSLRRHMLGVEACMLAYAQKFGENAERWQVTALLHDFDWEIHPNSPCLLYTSSETGKHHGWA